MDSENKINILVVGSGMAAAAARALVVSALPLAKVVLIDSMEQQEELANSMLEISKSLRIEHENILRLENKLEDFDPPKSVLTTKKPKKKRMSRIEKQAMHGNSSHS
jgi:threonine dehydrogenase-like Zn-dependent dehydrogenase